MVRLIARRILWIIPVMLTILVIVFFLMHSIPGGPWDGDPTSKRAMANLAMDPTTLKALNRHFGLDEPLWKQFIGYVIGRTPPKGEFICGLICGNLGPSYRQAGRSIQDILFQPPKGRTFFESRIGYSLRLSSYSFLLALVIGVPLGLAAALRQGSLVDYLIKGFATLLISMPNFVIGLLLIITLAGDLHLIVISPRDWTRFDPRVWVTPIIILGIGTLAAFIRITRASVLEVMRKDYVRTARSKGASERRVTYLHILRNALIPLITFSGAALLELFAGSFVIETMFGYPGMGRQFIDAVQTRDYSMIMGATLIFTLLVALSNLLVDLLYGFIDPRIRVSD